MATFVSNNKDLLKNGTMKRMKNCQKDRVFLHIKNIGGTGLK